MVSWQGRFQVHMDRGREAVRGSSHLNIIESVFLLCATADTETALSRRPSKQIRGRKLHDEMVEVYGALLMKVKARMDAGEDVPDCLAKTLWQIRDQENLDWEDMCMLTAVFVLGGVHSVRNIYS